LRILLGQADSNLFVLANLSDHSIVTKTGEYKRTVYIFEKWN